MPSSHSIVCLLVAVDRVNYNNGGAWPSQADGQGPSVARVSGVRDRETTGAVA